jgi:hypothetical protein
MPVDFDWPNIIVIWFFIQMLADMDNSVMFHTTGLADDSTLCAKKDIILAKFDALLKKLGGEVYFRL